jgi:hypothetical protein
MTNPDKRLTRGQAPFESATLETFVRALVPLVADELQRRGASVAVPRPFSQRDGERPAGCGRARFLRVWRAASIAHHEGATRDGRARLLTPVAYSFGVAELARRTAKPSGDLAIVAQDEDADLLTDLGLERKAS